MRLRGTIRQVRPRLEKVEWPTRQIYAYRNVQTNQVLYSIPRILQPSALNQLPDLGANKKPVSIRPDLWRPFFVVYFPDSSNGRAQCEYAFARLRHYRKLHEHYWERPAELEVRYTEDQLEHITDQLKQRGGSKKNNPYDMIKRYNRHLKTNTIMDQKANSVADLAASIADMAREWEKRERTWEWDILAKRRAIVSLARSAITNDKLQAKKERIRQEISQTVYQESAEYIAARKEYRELEVKYQMYKKRGTRKELQAQLRSQMDHLKSRIKSLKPVSKRDLQRELRLTDELLSRRQSAVETQHAAEKEAAEYNARVKVERTVTQAETGQAEEGKDQQGGLEGEEGRKLPERTWHGALEAALQRDCPRPWPLKEGEGIQINWVDMRDATFAQQWPEKLVEMSEWDVTKEDLQRPRRVSKKPRKTPKQKDIASLASRQLWNMIRERGPENTRWLRKHNSTEASSVDSEGKVEA